MKILRPKKCYGEDGKTGAGKTKFWEDFVLHDEADPYVPGTKVKRLRRVRLGPKAVGFVEGDVDRLIVGLAAEGDRRKPPARRCVTAESATTV